MNFPFNPLVKLLLKIRKIPAKIWSNFSFEPNHFLFLELLFNHWLIFHPYCSNKVENFRSFFVNFSMFWSYFEMWRHGHAKSKLWRENLNRKNEVFPKKMIFEVLFLQFFEAKWPCLLHRWIFWVGRQWQLYIAIFTLKKDSIKKKLL